MEDRYKNRTNEENDVQSELERQIRALGDTVSDAALHGFEGRGQDIGDAAAGVGRAAVNMANYGLNRAQRVMNRYARRGGSQQDGMPDWARNIFGQDEPNPADGIRASARTRWGTGLALMIVGGFFAFSFAVSGLAVWGAMSSLTPTVSGLIIEGVEFAETAAEFAAEFGSAAYTAMGVMSGIFGVAAAGFVYMMVCGWRRIKASRWLNRCADTVDGMDVSEGVSLGLLADNSTEKPKKILNKTRKMIQKGWLTAWLDEQAGKIYLTAQDYRAAQEKKRAPAPEPAAEEPPETGVPVNLETARRFVDVLEKEKRVMRDERAVEELSHMQETASAICDWLEEHPESLPKTRRFAEYYIPTTLKLLHTYNDVQGQKGENAEAIQRDIAGILHTLNIAYDNLYNKLLSDAALDVSSEIAALQGMLANDGLTGEGLMK